MFVITDPGVRADAAKIAWSRPATQTLRQELAENSMAPGKPQELRRATLWRYTVHRKEALCRIMAAALPLTLLTLPLRLKLDETQQTVLTEPAFMGVLTADGAGTRFRAMVVNTLVAISYLKTNLLAYPAPWAGPLLEVARNTAECIFVGVGVLLSGCPWLEHLPAPGGRRALARC